MFTFVKPSRMQGDFVYQFVLKKNKTIFEQRYKKAKMKMGESDWQFNTDYVNSFLTSNIESWRDVFHPIFGYWLAKPFKNAVEKGNKEEIGKQLMEMGRFFFMGLYKMESSEHRRMLLFTDDQGKVNFPGSLIYLSFGSNHSNEKIVCIFEDEGVTFEFTDKKYFAKKKELLGTGKVSQSFIKRKHMLKGTLIELDAQDHFVKKYLMNDVIDFVPKRGRNISIESKEEFELSDIWYYEKSLSLIKENWEEMYNEILGHIKLLCLSDSRVFGGFTSTMFQGAVYLSHRREDMQWTVENLIHECSHARLNHLFEIDELVLNEDCERFFSPWREDPRPMVGIFHGAYVFTRIAIWYSKLRDIFLSTLVDDRLNEVISDVNKALIVIGKQGKLTDIGKAVLDEMEVEIGKLSNLVNA